MVLIIGGAYQGKGEFALKLADGDEDRILFNVHDRIEAGLRAGRAREEIEAELLSEISGREELILTADEVCRPTRSSESAGRLPGASSARWQGRRERFTGWWPGSR